VRLTESLWKENGSVLQLTQNEGIGPMCKAGAKTRVSEEGLFLPTPPYLLVPPPY